MTCIYVRYEQTQACQAYEVYVISHRLLNAKHFVMALAGTPTPRVRPLSSLLQGLRPPMPSATLPCSLQEHALYPLGELCLILRDDLPKLFIFEESPIGVKVLLVPPRQNRHSVEIKV